MQKSIPYGLNNSLYSLMKAPQGAFFIDRGRMAKTNPAQGENGVDMDEQHEDLDLHDDDHQEASPEEDWKAQARKWERRAKENQDAAQRLAEAEKRALEAERQWRACIRLESRYRRERRRSHGVRRGLGRFDEAEAWAAGGLWRR